MPLDLDFEKSRFSNDLQFNEYNGLDGFTGPVARFTDYNQGHIYNTLKSEYEVEKGIIPDFSNRNISGIFVDKISSYDPVINNVIQRGVTEVLDYIVPSPIQTAVNAANIIDNIPATLTALKDLQSMNQSGIANDSTIRDTVNIGANVVQSLLPFTPAATVAAAIQTGFKLGDTISNVIKITDKIFGNPNAENPAPIDSIQLNNLDQKNIDAENYGYFGRSGGISYPLPSAYVGPFERGDLDGLLMQF